MKSFLRGLIIFTALSLLAACHSVPINPIDGVREKVVELHITLKEDPAAAENKQSWRVEKFAGKAICSGAFVTPNGDIITAKHCTDAADGITVVTSDRQEYAATVVIQSATQDLSLIHIDRRSTPFFTLADGTTQGQPVHTYGSPLGITGTYTTGVIARLNGDITYVDCGVLPGNSGGPAFNDAGELVGVTTAGFIVMLGTTHLNIMQSIDSIALFLAAAAR